MSHSDLNVLHMQIRMRLMHMAQRIITVTDWTFAEWIWQLPYLQLQFGAAF